MAFKFNPFTGTLDQTGSGGGASYIDGEVQNFSALPETIGTPAVDSAYLVREAEGTWLLARKPAGIYIRTADTGVRAADWTHASAFPDVFSDAAFTVFSDGDSTKNLQLSLSGITTGTTRTLTAPNKSGTIALTTDIPSVNDIELETDGTTTITTAQLPARGIAYAPEGESTYTVNLPTPDIRQSGLTFSLKTEYEEGTGTVFVTVVHAAVNLLTTYELDEDEGSIDFVWDGYAWRYDTAYLLRSFPSRVLQLPAASGTIALTSDFDAPPAIGSTTPNTGAFTTLNATGTTELVNGGTTAGPFHLYKTYTDASNHERGFLQWNSNNFDIGCEAAGTGTLRNVRIKTDATSGVSGAGYIEFGGSGIINTIKSVGGTANGALYIYSQSTLRMLIGGSSGTQFYQLIFPSGNGALDIGRTGNRWRDVFCRSVDLTGDLILTTTTGTKIGTATTQKLGFFNATPVVQQAAVADATDAATAITQLNDLLARLRTLGLIAT
jgi:hypothetical protein